MLALTATLLLMTAPAADRRCELDLRSNFAVAPRTIFPYLSDGDKIRWLGPFKITKVGDTDPFGRGSVREVRLLGIVVREEVTRYEPPGVLDYAVVEGRAYRNHVASMRVSETSDGGSHLTWTVRFESAKRNPKRHCRFVHRYLRRRLAKLRRRVRRDQP